jgi:hypothetical protein
MIRTAALLLFLVPCTAPALVKRAPAGPPKGGEVKEEVKLPKLLAGKPLADLPKDNELGRLLKARYNAALEESQARYQEYAAGKVSLDQLSETLRRLMDAGVEAREAAADQMALREQFVELAREVERASRERHGAGRISAAEMARARYLRLDAEVNLARARRDAAINKGK